MFRWLKLAFACGLSTRKTQLFLALPKNAVSLIPNVVDFDRNFPVISSNLVGRSLADADPGKNLFKRSNAVLLVPDASPLTLALLEIVSSANKERIVSFSEQKKTQTLTPSANLKECILYIMYTHLVYLFYIYL
jgi:hypothetical protein